jgi:hypothetical protein
MSWFDRALGPSYVAGTMRRAAIALGLSALLVVPGLAFSQNEGDEAPPPPAQEETEKPPREDATRSDAPYSIGGVDAASVPTAEKQAKVEVMLAEQRQIMGRASELLKEARAAKDIVQLNCINEKLTQIKGLLKISENASVQMYEAISRDEEDIINHEFTKITVAHQRCVTLGAEAEQCVGEIAVYTGQTEVNVEVDEDIGDDDPTEPPPVGPAPIVPPFASAL